MKVTPCNMGDVLEGQCTRYLLQIHSSSYVVPVLTWTNKNDCLSNAHKTALHHVAPSSGDNNSGFHGYVHILERAKTRIYVSLFR